MTAMTGKWAARQLPSQILGAVPQIHVSDPEVRFLDDPPGPEWNAFVQKSPDAHLGAAAQWFTIIEKAYRHRPLYLVVQEDSPAETTLLPSFLVRRWPLKTVVTSMPFLDAGGPVGGTGPQVLTAIKCLLETARKHGAAEVELRCMQPLDMPVPPSLQKVTLVRTLPADDDALWRELDSKVRNQIRKAERSGISTQVGGVEHLDDFYRVFAVNMRDLGSPVHSRDFFRRILEVFGQAARIVIARKEGVPVGGLIAIDFGGTCYVPWASTLRSHSALCPNMLMYWETLRRACLDGATRFDFGRSTQGSGTYKFKRQWGATAVQLYWYTVSLSGRAVTHVSKEDARWATLSQAWTRLPVPITGLIGPLLRKRLTQ